jgi:hypothetical protein
MATFQITGKDKCQPNMFHIGKKCTKSILKWKLWICSQNQRSESLRRYPLPDTPRGQLTSNKTDKVRLKSFRGSWRAPLVHALQPTLESLVFLLFFFYRSAGRSQPLHLGLPAMMQTVAFVVKRSKEYHFVYLRATDLLLLKNVNISTKATKFSLWVIYVFIFLRVS